MKPLNTEKKMCIKCGISKIKGYYENGCMYGKNHKWIDDCSCHCHIGHNNIPVGGIIDECYPKVCGHCKNKQFNPTPPINTELRECICLDCKSCHPMCKKKHCSPKLKQPEEGIAKPPMTKYDKLRLAKKMMNEESEGYYSTGYPILEQPKEEWEEKLLGRSYVLDE